MGNKIFDSNHLNKMNKYQLIDERRVTEREIQKQIRMLNRFGTDDKYHEERNRHLNLLYEKRSFIEKCLHNLKKK